MKTEGRHPEEGTESDDNVVRFPREWIGPREELVPIGVADHDEGSAPPAPDDFWGAGSAEVQSALRAPTADGGAGGGQAASTGRHGGRVRLRLGRAGTRRGLIGVAVLALVAVVVGLSGLGSSGGRRSGRATRSVSRHDLASLSSVRAHEAGSRKRATTRRSRRGGRRPSRARANNDVRASTARRIHHRRARASTPSPTTVSYVPATSSGGGSSGLHSSSDYSSQSSASTGSQATGGAVSPGPTSLGGAVGNNCNPKCS